MLNKKPLTIIPSAFTCMNIALGFLAILINQPVLSCILILAGAFMDIIDGMAARMLNATSELGKQLDSLADLVTFGVAPAFLFYNIAPHNWMGMLAASSIPVGAAIRLARFNLSTDQTHIFKGLPSPANGMFFAAFPLLIQKSIFSFEYGTFNTLFLYLLPIVFAVLMNINIPLFSLKSLKSGLKHNLAFAVFVVISVIILIAFPVLFNTTILLGILSSIPFIIAAYILVSVFFSKQILKTAAIN